VDHILGNKSSDNAYVLLHPEVGKYIWFPDIYIGKYLNIFVSAGTVKPVYNGHPWDPKKRPLFKG
jgi:hypothetical protein